MLLANYASDSDEGSDNESGPSRPPIKASAPAPPAAASASSAKVKRKAPVKITLDLPKSSTPGAGSRDDGDLGDKVGSAGNADADAAGPDAKKPKLGGLKGGKGSSSLLGMLPPPKRKAPAAQTGKGSSLSVNKAMANPRPTISVPKPAANLPAPPGHDSDDDDDEPAMLLPPSVQRKAAKGKEPSLDLFGLAPEAESSSSSRTRTGATVTAAAVPPPMSISSAPAVADFVPPEPTPNDPYPGYYQLPSGEWAAYEPEYYHSFFPDAPAVGVADGARGDGRVGRHWDELNSKGADFIDIDVTRNLEEARAEKERRERMVKPKLPSDEVEYKAVGQIKGLATQKHQLSSLLNTAYTQREELENRIASNKKNMRVAGQKYGF